MRRVFVVCVVLSVTGCSSRGQEDVVHERMIGTIAFYEDPVQVEIPDTVQRGVTFPVTVRTYGGGCIEKGDTEVEVAGLAALITPYDREVTRMPENFACTAELRFYVHAAEVGFDESGTAVVTVRGRKKPENTVIEVKHRVVVE